MSSDRLPQWSTAFDRAGNILPVDTLGVETATYDATTNRLLRRTTSTGGSVTSGYDRAGNLTQRFDTLSPPVTWAYGYDALERLVSVRRNGTLIARYGYDVQGRRIVKRVYSSVSGGTVGYLRMSYAGSQVSFETDSVGSTLRTRYTWGPGTDQLVSFRDTTNTHYVAVTDQLGSVRALVKRDGTWAGRLRYDPYGNLVDSAGPQPALRYRWTGREWDAETGFYFHRTRYYDPRAQRFVQEDKVGYAGGANLYGYVSGAPLTRRDPNGHGMICEWSFRLVGSRIDPGPAGAGFDWLTFIWELSVECVVGLADNGGIGFVGSGSTSGALQPGDNSVKEPDEKCKDSEIKNPGNYEPLDFAWGLSQPGGGSPNGRETTIAWDPMAGRTSWVVDYGPDQCAEVAGGANLPENAYVLGFNSGHTHVRPCPTGNGGYLEEPSGIWHSGLQQWTGGDRLRATLTPGADFIRTEHYYIRLDNSGKVVGQCKVKKEGS